MPRFAHHFVAATLATSALASPFAARAADAVDPASRFATLTAEAEAAYAARDFEGAIAKYLAAYEVIATPDVLYNVAFIYEDTLKRRDQARNFYERIVRSPDSRPELLKLANERLAIIAKKDAEDSVRPTLLTGSGQPTPGPTTPGVGATLPPRPVDDGPGPGPWILVGTGGALIVGGIVAGLQAMDSQSAFDAIELTDANALAAARDEAEEGEGAATVADVLIFGGAAVALGGLVWYFVAAPDSDQPKSALSLQPRLGAGVVAADIQVSF